MVWNPATGPLADPWAALHLVEIDSPDMKANITDNFNALQAMIVVANAAYTPTLIQNTAVTKTVNNARYSQLGKNAKGNVAMTATAVGTVSNSIASSLPVTPLYSSSAALTIGTFVYIRASGARQSGAVVITGSTGAVIFQAAERSNVLGQDPTTAIAVGDVLSFNFDYETV